MHIKQATLAVAICTFFAQTLVSSSPVIKQRTCGTAPPSDELRAAHRYLSTTERQAGDIAERSTPHIVIDTYFHIVSSTANQNQVTDSMIRGQYTYLEEQYANASISYRLQGVDRTINDTWAQNGDDLSMKTALRKGTYSTLNVYFQTDLQPAPSTGSFPTGEILLGVCTLPSPGVTPSTPPSAYVLDGCNVLAGTMPGGPVYGYNLGGTAVHEIGHWNGLLHPFQDNTCDPTDRGDYVADTPQESTATSGCPAGKDSCPNSPGLDPVSNFMDYSDDACHRGFSNGQTWRMQGMWGFYRNGR